LICALVGAGESLYPAPMQRRPSVLALSVSALLAFAACDDGSVAPAAPRDLGPSRGDLGPMVDGGTSPIDLGPTPPGLEWSTPPTRPSAGTPTDVAAGNVSGAWCGALRVNGDVTVAVGETLTVCAGATVAFADDAGLTVRGTLRVEGDARQPVFFYAGGSGMWPGVSASGTVVATYLDVSGAGVAIETMSGADVTVTRAWLHDSAYGLRIAGGGTFDRVAVRGGGPVYITSGTLRMTDSIIDLVHPLISPDCTDFRGGGAVLDHVRFTGCHCPLHINSTDRDVMITNSLFDGATVAWMIAESNATAHGNAFIAATGLQDIGGSITADVSGNYWETTNDLSTGAPAQFTGVDDQLAARPADVGPRP